MDGAERVKDVKNRFAGERDLDVDEVDCGCDWEAALLGITGAPAKP